MGFGVEGMGWGSPVSFPFISSEPKAPSYMYVHVYTYIYTVINDICVYIYALIIIIYICMYVKA